MCEVRCYADGTFRIISGNPDPVYARSGLRVFEADVAQAIKISTHFLTTGRVCANCAITRYRKMRHCPCDKAYYCGKECQKQHWRMHRACCTAR